MLKAKSAWTILTVTGKSDVRRRRLDISCDSGRWIRKSPCSYKTPNTVKILRTYIEDFYSSIHIEQPIIRRL